MIPAAVTYYKFVSIWIMITGMMSTTSAAAASGTGLACHREVFAHPSPSHTHGIIFMYCRRGQCSYCRYWTYHGIARICQYARVSACICMYCPYCTMYILYFKLFQVVCA
jgi:hypothetical protein